MFLQARDFEIRIDLLGRFDQVSFGPQPVQRTAQVGYMIDSILILRYQLIHAYLTIELG
ncbi:MAG: hypothetical protein O7A03_10645 [Alphaproteobacteria bacterium]|nr:hypothetical protein [Alphaproteobacteria bacterium]